MDSKYLNTLYDEFNDLSYKGKEHIHTFLKNHERRHIHIDRFLEETRKLNLSNVKLTKLEYKKVYYSIWKTFVKAALTYEENKMSRDMESAILKADKEMKGSSYES